MIALLSLSPEKRHLLTQKEDPYLWALMRAFVNRTRTLSVNSVAFSPHRLTLKEDMVECPSCGVAINALKEKEQR